MRLKYVLKAPQFSIRAVLVLTALVALGLFAWRERLRYLHEHISVSVVNAVTGVQLTRFQYQTSVITSETGEFEVWSEWQTHEGQNALTMKTPKYCRFQFKARALDIGGGYAEKQVSTLVLPEAFQHTTTLRLVEGKSLESFLVDSGTLEPIANAKIVPTSVDRFEDLTDFPGYSHSSLLDLDFATSSDSGGKFIVRNLDEWIAIVAPKHQRQVIHFKDASAEDLSNWVRNGIQLEPAVRLAGQVRCKESGMPIPGCVVALDRWDFREDFPEGLESRMLASTTELDRQTRTDESGCFELFADGRMEDSRIRISKKGWRVDLFSPVTELVDVALEPMPLVIAGTVADEFGSPIREFEVLTEAGWFTQETHAFKSELGRFEIRAYDRPFGYTIRAKGKADFSKGMGNLFEEDGEDHRGFIEEAITMTRGFSIKGTLVGHESHATDVWFELSPLQKRMDRGWQTREIPVYTRVQAKADGSFQLDHVSDGTYRLVTSMFGHVVNTRPIVVKSQDVAVGPIPLPATGSIRGRVHSEDGVDVPFHQMYIIDDHGSPVRWFHTDHRGEFELKNVPAGWVGIGPKPERLMMLMCGTVGWPTHDSMVVEPGKTSEVSFEDYSIFELDGLPHQDEHWGNVNVSKRSAPSENTYVQTQGIKGEFNKLTQVMSHCKAKEGEEFSLKMSYGHCLQELPLVVQADPKKLPNKILFRSLKIHFHFADTSLQLHPGAPEPILNRLDSLDPFDEPNRLLISVLESEPYVGSTTIFLLKEGRVMSKVSMTGLHEKIQMMSDGEPDEAVIHNTIFGWACIEQLRLADGRSSPNEVQFKKGAELHGQLNLAGLPIMPSCIRVIDQRGVVFIADASQLFEFKLPNLWPGKWLLQAIGDDPVLGKRVLAERRVELDGTDCHSVEF